MSWNKHKPCLYANSLQQISGKDSCIITIAAAGKEGLPGCFYIIEGSGIGNVLEIIPHEIKDGFCMADSIAVAAQGSDPIGSVFYLMICWRDVHQVIMPGCRNKIRLDCRKVWWNNFRDQWYIARLRIHLYRPCRKIPQHKKQKQEDRQYIPYRSFPPSLLSLLNFLFCLSCFRIFVDHHSPHHGIADPHLLIWGSRLLQLRATLLINKFPFIIFLSGTQKKVGWTQIAHEMLRKNKLAASRSKLDRKQATIYSCQSPCHGTGKVGYPGNVSVYLQNFRGILVYWFAQITQPCCNAFIVRTS